MTEEKEKTTTHKSVSRRQFIAGTVGGFVVGAAAGAVTGSLGFPKTITVQPWLPASWDYTADVVVVGYGFAGLCAAIAATDAGAKVLVLEKAPTGLPSYGNSGVCGGGAIVGEPVADNATFFKIQGWGTVNDDALCTATAQAFDDLPSWMESIGVPIYTLTATATSAVCVPSSVLAGLVSPSFSFNVGNKYNIYFVKKPDGTSGAGRDWWTALNTVATSKNIQVMFATPATDLIQNPETKEILGVKALTGVTYAAPPSYAYAGGTSINVKASRAVVMACGGFENNNEMTQNYLPCSHSNFVTPIGSPYNTGDGIPMVTRVGAKLWHMTCGESYLLASLPASKELGNALNTTAFGDDQMILVNRYGERFMDETIYYTHTKRTLPLDNFKDDVPPTDPDDYCDYPNRPFWAVFDSTRMKAGILGYPAFDQAGYSYPAGWLGAHELYHWSSDNSAELSKGWIIESDTLQGLATSCVSQDFFGRKITMDPAGLTTTLTNYNKYCAAASDPDFSRNPKTMTPIQTPPFYAMELCLAMLNTNGGPVHNQYSQTIDVDGNVIPRLYSAGEFGSIYGFLYQGAGNVPEAQMMGKVAGENAAAETPWS